MAGPLSFWANRKSRNGARHLSRVPQRHREPWCTTPPIAKETKETTMAETVNEKTLSEMRRILRGMARVMGDEDPSPQLLNMLDTMDDARLCAVAQEALANFQRSRGLLRSLSAEVKETKKAIDVVREENKAAERTLIDAAKAIKERDDLAEKYKELKKQVDPEKQQLEVMYAIEEATKKQQEEIAATRRELAQRTSEVAELRESKKRLKEALNRLADK